MSFEQFPSRAWDILAPLIAASFVIVPLVYWLSTRSSYASRFMRSFLGDDPEEYARLRIAAPILFVLGVFFWAVILSGTIRR